LRFGGTSGATAKVAGVVALMLEKNDRLTPQEIRTILMGLNRHVVDQGANVGTLLDANKAVCEAIGMCEAADGDYSTTPMNRTEVLLHSLTSVGKTV
jgi:subtilisin family serine protease